MIRHFAPTLSSVMVGLCLLAACHESPEAPMQPLAPPIHVESEAVSLRPMPRALPLYGALVADQRADVAANVSGRVAKTYVERGAQVNAGAALVQIDISGAALSAAEAQANLDNAEAQDQLASQQCARNEQLFNKGAISKDEWDRVSNQCKTATQSKAAARARVGLAAKIVADSRVPAPFAGTISERYVNVGEYVQPASKVAAIVALDPLRLQLTVAEADIGRVSMGQQVAFTVAAFSDKTFVGTVKYIDPAVRSMTRDLRVDAVVPNPERELSPGMSAKVLLKLPDAPSLSVPMTAVREAGRGSAASARVFVVQDKRLEERAVQLGPKRDDRVAILDGLRAGEQVVTTLTDAIKDGIAVD
jgi:RND family efflux transporter MFP subunit